MLRTLIRATAAGGAAVAVYVGLTLPPARVHLDAALPPTDVPGAYHVHTVRSDGSGTIDAVAAAARRSGLRFVIVTDHGDATRVPDPPAYRNEVLVIDAVEISTREGHLVALGLPGAAPYPLAGAARDVLDDVHRLGGRAVVAHPDSPSPALRWNGQGQQGFDGIEWINLDSEWRDDAPWRILGTAARSLIRPPEAIATLLSRPVRSLQRWDGAERQRPVFGLAALDAHARIGWREAEEPRRGGAVNRPSYAALFDTLAQVAVLDAPLSGEPRQDAAAVLSALTGGRSYSIVRAFADPAALDFGGERGSESIRMGERTPAAAGPVSLHASVPGAPGVSIALYANGRVSARGNGALHADVSEPGVYRVEVAWPGRDVPWIVSNPIVLTADSAPVPAQTRTPAGVEDRKVSIAPDAWRIEKDASSTGMPREEAGALRLDFALGAGAPQGQYVALATPVSPDAGVDRIQVTLRADRPMRLSLQARLPGGRDGQRWRRSVYVDETPRPIVVRLQDFEPADTPTSRRPIVAPVTSVLVVVDTVNTRPGDRGTVWISDVTLGVNRLP